jgi:adenylosuccinate lyase
MAEKVMLELVDRGMPRDMAHEVLRSASMIAVESGSNLEVVCRDSESIMNLFDEDEISGLFEPESHLGSSAQIVDRSIEIARDQSSEK